MTAQQIKERIGDILNPNHDTHQVTTPSAAAGFPTLLPNATKAQRIPEPASYPGSNVDVSNETHFTGLSSGSLGQNQAPPKVPLDEAALLGIAPVPTPPGRSTFAEPDEQNSSTAPTTPPSDDKGLDVIGEEGNSDSKGLAIIPVQDLDSKELPIVPVSDVQTVDREVTESDVKTKNYPAPQPDVQEKNLPGTEPEGEKPEDESVPVTSAN